MLSTGIGGTYGSRLGSSYYIEEEEPTIEDIDFETPSTPFVPRKPPPPPSEPPSLAAVKERQRVAQKRLETQARRPWIEVK